MQVRDAQELTKLQADFMQAQMQAMTEQAKDLSETATKALTERAKTPAKGWSFILIPATTSQVSQLS